MVKLGANELRRKKPTEKELSKIKRRPIYLVLDNVLDTYNIGGLFRLADALGVKKIILCGQSETPPSSRIHKAAVGLEEWVQWRHEPSAQIAISNLKEKVPNIKVVAVEQSSKSTPYTKLDQTLISPNLPLAIVVGHETNGISKNVLEAADAIVEIPLFGVNKSLNVIVSAAIVLYKVVEKREGR